jgi:hypothetical protein
MSQKTIIDEPKLLERLQGITNRTLKELRYRKKIRFYAPSYRIRLYCWEDVLEDLEKLAVHRTQMGPDPSLPKKHYDRVGRPRKTQPEEAVASK